MGRVKELKWPLYNSENHVDLYVLSTSPEGHSQEICQTKRINALMFVCFFKYIH